MHKYVGDVFDFISNDDAIHYCVLIANGLYNPVFAPVVVANIILCGY